MTSLKPCFAYWMIFLMEASGTKARRAEVGLSALAQGAGSAFAQGRYEATLSALDRRRAFVPEPRDLATLRAWSIYHLGDRERARAIFATLDRQMSTPETRSGMAATGPRTG